MYVLNLHGMKRNTVFALLALDTRVRLEGGRVVEIRRFWIP